MLENKELADIVVAIGCGVGKDFDIGQLRYGAHHPPDDADSDGHHISTLLLTFFYRHMPGAPDRTATSSSPQPPLYRIDIGKETHWALDDADKARILKAAGKDAKKARSPASRASAR